MKAVNRFFDDVSVGLSTAARLMVVYLVTVVAFISMLAMDAADRAAVYFARLFHLGNPLQSGITASDVHIDVPLSNMAVMAFNGGNLIGEALFPPVPVDKQSDKYYVMNKADWLRLPDTTLRGPKQSPRRVEFSVSSESYYALNYALAGENAFEALANADRAIQLRRRTAMFVTNVLRRSKEQRIASKVTSISNLGSGVALSGTSKWSDYANSDPVAAVNTAHAFIRGVTGFTGNVAVIDYDTMVTLRRHPVLLDMYKYTQGGQVTDGQIAEQFRVSRIIIADAIKENAREGGTSSMTNMWGNYCGIFHVEPASTMEDVMTFGQTFRWTNPLFGVPFAVRTYDDPDKGKLIEVTDCSYYDDEKVIARDLSYGITGTL